MASDEGETKIDTEYITPVKAGADGEKRGETNHDLDVIPPAPHDGAKPEADGEGQAVVQEMETIPPDPGG